MCQDLVWDSLFSLVFVYDKMISDIITLALCSHSFKKMSSFEQTNRQDGKKPLEVMLAQIRAIRANRFPGKEPGDGEVFVRLRPLATLHLLHPSDLVVWCLLPVL